MTSCVTKKVSYLAFSFDCRLSKSDLSVGQSRLPGRLRSREGLGLVKVPLHCIVCARSLKNYAKWASPSHVSSLQRIPMPWYIRLSNSYDNCWVKMFAMWRFRQQIKK